MIESARIDRWPHGARREQRLDLRSEIETVALPRPVQRADAHAIAREQHEASREVDEHESELALEMLEQGLAMLFVEVHDHLRVGVALEDVALGSELGLQLGIIEQLAIGDNADAAGLVEDRLLTVGDADDGEPAVAHGDARSHQVADTVRPTMLERGRHTAHQSPVGFTGTFEIENARYAAHCSSME